MSDWKPVALGCLCVLGGILLTHLLFLYSQFNADSQGYMWRAARKLWGFVLPFFLVEWVAGCFFFLPIYFIPVNYLSGYLPADYLSGYRMHLIIAVIAAVIGFLVAFAPTALELHSLPEEGVTVASLQKPLTR